MHIILRTNQITSLINQQKRKQNSKTHKNTPNKQTTARYFEDTSNSSFLANEAPANLGTWMGWQIINEYMKKSGNSPMQLMQITNAQEILRIAEYK